MIRQLKACTDGIIDIKSHIIYDAVMRTTLTIDDDLAAQIQEQRRRHGHSLKRVINALLREGLQSRQKRPRAKKYRTRVHKLGLRPGFDPVKLNQLVDELEIDERREREDWPRQ